MTAYSLRIFELPPGATPAHLEAPDFSAPVAQGLARYADQCGPYGLQAWAERRGHDLHYVDNCWVRARVLGRDLPAFFQDVLKAEPHLNPAIRPDQEYVIEAEEY